MLQYQPACMDVSHGEAVILIAGSGWWPSGYPRQSGSIHRSSACPLFLGLYWGKGLALMMTAKPETMEDLAGRLCSRCW